MSKKAAELPEIPESKLALKMRAEAAEAKLRSRTAERDNARASESRRSYALDEAEHRVEELEGAIERVLAKRLTKCEGDDELRHYLKLIASLEADSEARRLAREALEGNPDGGKASENVGRQESAIHKQADGPPDGSPNWTREP